MYDPIFAKSFSRYERKRFGCCGLVLFFIFASIICSTLKPHLHPLSIIGGAVNLQLSLHAVEDMLITDAMSHNSKTNVGSAPNLHILVNASQNTLVPNDTNTTTSQPVLAIESKKMERLCRTLKGGADYCEIEGDIRLDANSSTVFVIRPRSTISEAPSNYSWIIQPYPRKGISHVKNWTVTLISNNDDRAPQCTKTHIPPALLFSVGGYTGNHFHDFADLILPLFSTSFPFKKEVHFLASDYKPWWPSKFRGLLDRLTRHEIVDIDRVKQVLCYNKMILGLQFYKELIIDPSISKTSSGNSMYEFRQFLRQTYLLERKRAMKGRKGSRPRLMIVSRKKTRVLTNEAEVSRVATKLGYKVVSAEAGMSTNLTMFAQIVNSCDVMMGVHGAGLTNMVFLPDNAVVIQVVPLGGIDVFARLDFGNPAPGMNLRYLEYKIKFKESSLGERYSMDNPVLKDPLSVHKKGWGQLRSIYLENQNVTIDLHRFKGTLAKALKLLRH